MANTSAHNKEMKNFVGAEIFVKRVENGELQGIDYTADRVNNAACKKPAESSVRERAPKGSEYQKA